MGIIGVIKQGWKDYLWITLGSIVTAVSIDVFMVPYKIAPGGVSGVATVVFYLSGGRLPVGVTMLALNIPLFIAGIKYIGKRFALRTFYGAILLSLIIDAVEPFTDLFVKAYLIHPESNPSQPDLLLYSVFGGFLMGIGLGVVLKSGATTGGSDLAARILYHFTPRFTIGQLLLFVDTSIIIFAAVSFNSFQLGLYAIVTLFISSKVIDALLEGVDFAKAVFVISQRPDIIAKRIMEDMDRGVTALRGVGMYTGSEKHVLLCVLDRRQLPVLKDIIREVDEKAFVILSDVREVFGEGFKTYE